MITEARSDKGALAHIKAHQSIQKIEDSSYEWEEGHSIKYGKYRVRKRYIGGLTRAEIAKMSEEAERLRKITAW